MKKLKDKEELEKQGSNTRKNKDYMDASQKMNFGH